jgi:hypothetical protein
VRHHLCFACALTVATALRVLAMAAYFPALWFNDSFDYVRIGVAPFPHPVRPAGYGMLLWVLSPFHSFAVVTAVQHLMGLGAGVLVYLVLRRFGLPGWGACLATAPVLFDAHEIELEQLVMSDVFFMFLVTCAVTIVLWRPSVTWRVGVVAGLLLSLATLTRTVGLPLIVVLLVMRWRAATALAAVVPLVAYALWFYAFNGVFALTGVDGVFLWGRTAAFADCAKIKPPPDLASLCPRLPVGRRPASSSQVWQAESPMGWRPGHAFDPDVDRRARAFALRAIVAQPGDYVVTVGRGIVLTFDWNRHAYPTSWTTGLYRFSAHPMGVPDSPVVGGGTAASVVHAYAGRSSTHVTSPYAGWLRGYQTWAYLRGPLLAVVLAVGIARRRGGTLPWAMAVCLLTVPLLTTDFDYRYLLPAAPLACLAAAVTFTSDPKPVLPVSSVSLPRQDSRV